MNEKIRMTLPTMRVLELFLANLSRGLAGAEISRETKLLSGSLYPILHRLERAGWLISELEDVDPSEAGRPRKRFYRLRAQARSVAWDALVSRGYFDDGAAVPEANHVVA